jgi:long-subunit acyl-CoA synthetase (AMP-forming)
MNQLCTQLQRYAQEQPERTLLVDEHCAMSAGQLLAAVHSEVARLAATGAGRIGLLADNGVAWVVCDLASQFAGLCLVPIPTFFSDRQIEHVLDSAAVDLLIVDEANVQRITGCIEPVAGLAGYYQVALQPQSVPQIPPGTTKITFTSGSTGEPKGVCLSFEQCLAVAQSLAVVLPVTCPRHLAVLPLSTLLENIGGVYLPLLRGGTAMLPSSQALGTAGSSGIDPTIFLATVQTWKPATMILVPQLLALFDSAIANGWRPPSTLEFVAVGGGRVAASIVARVRSGGMPVYEGYGLSECASVVSLNTPCADRTGTSGRVLSHVTVTEQDGELEVSGNAFLGYLNQPDSWGIDKVATGDLGHVDDDGYVSIEGRSKSVLISSFGRNISPEWVESELLASGLLQQVLVLGDGRPYCTALIWSANSRLSRRQLQAELDRVNGALPDYAQVRDFYLMPEPMTLINGLLTENGRPRRARIEQCYQTQIEQLYSPTPESIAL